MYLASIVHDSLLFSKVGNKISDSSSGGISFEGAHMKVTDSNTK
jgi:hypothetical protein